jgi:PKD repeat protein
VSITFELVGEGSTALSLVDEDVSVSGETQSLTVGTLTDGSVDATSGTTTASADVSVGSASGTVGDNVTVDVTVDGDSVAGAAANVTFDPNVVQVQSVAGGDLGSPTVNTNNAEGFVFVSTAQATGVTDPTVVSITFELVGEGSTALSLVDEDVSVSGETQSLTVGTLTDGQVSANELPPLDSDESAPNDLDDDGVYEDVNGNGEADYDDVALLFQERNSDAVQNNQEQFDFNGNGRFDFNDLVVLFNKRGGSAF